MVVLALISGCSTEPTAPADGSSEQGRPDLAGTAFEGTTARCQDGLDNDKDGNVDCRDQDCWGFAFCRDSGAVDSPGQDAPGVDKPRPIDLVGPPDASLPDVAAGVDLSPASDVAQQVDAQPWPDTGSLVDVTPWPDLPLPDGMAPDMAASCATHCDCVQGAFCYIGKCITDPKMAVYCCSNKPCPPGRWCVDSNGKKGTCAEDSTHKCKDACDCGPAHCCKGGMCVKDVQDLWIPGGKAVGPHCKKGVDPTYCCSAPECNAGYMAYGQHAGQFFRCYNVSEKKAQRRCGEGGCFGTSCNCAPGESCVDTVSGSPPGSTCLLLSGGSCVSNAVARSLFGFKSNELLPCCKGGCLPGSKCEVGWRSDGQYAYRRVVATCGLCGNGLCDEGEFPKTCPKDCSCGDGVCAPGEVTSCAADCGTCGNGKCEPPAENFKRCKLDCPEICGDGWCGKAESVSSCAQDCKNRCADSAQIPGYHRVCGDGVCLSEACLDPETCLTCPQDCGKCDTWKTLNRSEFHLVPGLEDIWGSSASNIYVAGIHGRLLHYDGTRWRSVYSGTDTYFWGVWGASPTDVFMAGCRFSPPKGFVVRHYDGQLWRHAFGGIPACGETIWGSSSTDVFAAGEKGTILHYDGKTWSPMATGTTSKISCLWGSSSTDVFAVGFHTPPLHYDGVGWSTMSTGAKQHLAVWGTSSSDVFAVGLGGLISHYDGKNWLGMTSGTAARLNAVWGTSASDVFAAGTKQILHYDGTVWKNQAQGDWTIKHIWGSSPTNVYAVGNGSYTDVILHYDGSTWSVDYIQSGLPLSDVWASSPTDIYAVGSNHIVLHHDGKSRSYIPIRVGGYAPAVWGTSPTDIFIVGNQILHWDGKAWSGNTMGITHYGVGGSGPKDVYTVGNGAIHHFNGVAWSAVNAGTSASLWEVWGSSASDIFLGGHSKSIYHYDGSTWTAMATNHAGYVRALWGSSSSDVYATGTKGMAIHYDGTSWAPLPLAPAASAYSGVTGRSATDVFVKTGGAFYHYDGQSWSLARLDRRYGKSGDSLTCSGLNHIRVGLQGNIYAVGHYETLMVHCPGGKCP